ncbi:hypothetical protein [Lacinutrix undariae]
MKTDNLKELFKNIDDSFDVETPNTHHEARFLNKLKNKDTKVVADKNHKAKIWKPLFAIAASIVLCLGLFITLQQNDSVKDLASVSPELSVTQNFFTAAIAQELTTLNNERTPKTAILIDDALKQLNTLEKEYETLKIDLTESGDDKRVIHAMISNFQNRIDVLNNVLQNIEEVKNLNTNTNEKSII